MADTGTDGPRLATGADFPEIMHLVDRCFGHSAGGMAAEWCHVYDETRPERHAIVREDGRVVSHISIVADELVIGDGSLPCWGITGVATDPRYRGRGHMSALLEFWTQRMDDAGIPFGKLGGDRRRYGRWGWEHAGRERRYRVTPRYLDTGQASDIEVTRYDRDEADFDLLDRLYADKPYRVRRDREQWHTRLNRVQFDTLIARGQGVEGYLVFSRTRRRRNSVTVSDVAGDERAIRALFDHVFEAYGRETLRVNVHPSDPLNAFLARPDVSGGWQTRPNRMVTVRRLPAVLSAYATELEAAWEAEAASTGELVVGIDGDENNAMLSWDGETVAVESTEADPEIGVDRMAMARLLFGDPSTVPGYNGHRLLEAVLPLNFYVPLVDRV